MNKAKRRRIEAAGWKVGSAREFLGLSDEESALIEVKLELGRALRTERTRRRMTQKELGRRLGSSQSRVAKMETADPSVSLDLLVRSLFGLGSITEDISPFVFGELARCFSGAAKRAA